MTYVNQAIMLYTLNLHGDIYNYFFNKTGKKIKKPPSSGWAEKMLKK